MDLNAKPAINITIAKARKQAGYTQQTFADKLQIKRATLGAYEEGRAAIKPDMLQQMASVLGISLQNLAQQISDQNLKCDIVDIASASKASQKPPTLFNTNVPQKSENLLSNITQKPVASTAFAPKKVLGVEAVITVLVDGNNTPQINLVGLENHKQYIFESNNIGFLSTLKTLSIPELNTQDFNRAFQLSTPDGTITLIGKLLRNWLTIENGKSYLVITTNGFKLGIVDNNLVSDGKIIMTEGVTQTEIFSDKINEIWQPIQILQSASQYFQNGNLKTEDLKKMLSTLISGISQ